MSNLLAHFLFPKLHKKKPLSPHPHPEVKMSGCNTPDCHALLLPAKDAATMVAWPGPTAAWSSAFLCRRQHIAPAEVEEILGRAQTGASVLPG